MAASTGWDPGFTERQAFEEYRYDALGRRVLLRSRGEWGCGGTGCRKLLQRFVWDGDQLLYEISAPGGTGESAANMERDVGHTLPPAPGAHYFTGRVAYTHGLGLDAPLAVIRVEHSALFDTPFVITPYTTWNGNYDSGSGAPCDQVWQPDTIPGDSVLVQVCVEIDWPAPYLWIAKLSRLRAFGPTTWLGSLIEGQRDLTGQLYRRNRYYDPASGRFTQEDPIGLAGGLNLYGFAGGDPVNFSDPFGLCVGGGQPPDSILVTVEVDCGDGTKGTRQVWAHRVPDTAPLTDAAERLEKGNSEFTPDVVQEGYRQVISGGGVYVFPERSVDGFPIIQGGKTQTGGGGLQYVAFRRDVWANIASGSLRSRAGNLGFNVCTVVGHEGVHLAQGMGYGRGGDREREALRVGWRCRR